MPRAHPHRRWHLAWLLCLAATLLAGCAALPAGSADPAAAAVSGDDYIIVAVADRSQARAVAGAAVRGNYARAGYGASADALSDGDALAAAHGLVEVKAWTIQALNWRCMLYRLPKGMARDELLQALAGDARVQLAQPLNAFETLAAPSARPVPAATAGQKTTATPPAYNDPYLSLQSGFLAIDAAGAHQRSKGEGIVVAVIDSHVDASHPDLQGRIAAQRDFAGHSAAADTHGTQVSGVIAAVADNGMGIAGVAPAARLLALRSCWSEAPGQAARCNSFTLAQGLAAAMAAGADVVNLSLGGPADPLLEALARRAMAQGTVIVAALPRSGRREGFPTALPGVLAVAASEGGTKLPGVLAAPGVQVLTLAAGGGYDYASGSSMASAHVSGAVALLLANRSTGGSTGATTVTSTGTRQMDSAQLLAALAGEPGQPIDACRALWRVSPALPPLACGARPAAKPPPGPSAAALPVQAPARP